MTNWKDCERQANELLGLHNSNNILLYDTPKSSAYQFEYYERRLKSDYPAPIEEPEEIKQARQDIKDYIVSRARQVATAKQLFCLDKMLDGYSQNIISQMMDEKTISNEQYKPGKVSKTLFGCPQMYNNEKIHYGGLCKKLYKILSKDERYIHLVATLKDLLT